VRDITIAAIVPKHALLYPSRPNPFHRETEISFELKAEAHVSLRIYDAAGRLVRTLENGRLAPDLHVRGWDGLDDEGTRVGAGVYFYSLDTGSEIRTQKMVLTR